MSRRIFTGGYEPEHSTVSLPDIPKGPTDGERVTMTGVLDKVWHSSPGFSAGLLATSDRQKHKIRGKFYCNLGSCIVVDGRWAEDPTHGMQIDVKSFAYATDAKAMDKAGLAHYLATSPDFKGLGPAKAQLLAEKYGDDFGGALADDLEGMADHAKVSLDSMTKIRDVWQANQTKNGTAAWLGQWGLTHTQTQKIIDAYGDSARKAMEENPYDLIGSIDGFGWSTVDSIAMRMGISKQHPGRLRAALLHAVASQLDEGSTWTAQKQLVSQAVELLFLDDMDATAKVEDALALALAERKSPLVEDSGMISDRVTYTAESRIYAWLAAARSNPVTPVRPVFGSKDNAGQMAAIAGALTERASVITGGAGVGKTYAIASIIRAFQAAGLNRIALCAFAGKAARRITESISDYGIEAKSTSPVYDGFSGELVKPGLVFCEGQTIHKLLGYHGEGRFFYNADLALPVDVVIVDEISMVASALLWQLLQAIDPTRTRVIFVGDQFQLPPIGGGNPLRDILKHGLLPVHYLTEVMRFGGDLKARCSDVLKGIVEPHRPAGLDEERQAWYVIAPQRHDSPQAVQATLLDLFENRIKKLQLTAPSIDGKQPGKLYAPDLLKDVQVITPVHKGVIGTIELNVKLQALVQRLVYGATATPSKPDQRPKPMPGDKVIQVRNNYKLGVMNGTLGVVVSVATEATEEITKDGKRKVKVGDMLIAFDGMPSPVFVAGDDKSDVQVAYALSVHKMQGSDVPIAVVVVSKSHAYSQSRSMLYTAVTRARQIAILVGDSWGIKHAAGRVVVDARRTLLDAWSTNRMATL